jgi:hypothetical protein
MKDIFGKIHPVDPKLSICHTGGAKGSDTIWENLTIQYGGKVNAYSYKTDYHNSPNKVEISEENYKEGVSEINKANHYLNRWGIHKFMNLLSRNWSQVKYSDQIVAIGNLVKKGKKSKSGYYNKGKYTAVDGGTGYAVMMGILNKKVVHVFDQEEGKWFQWNYQIEDFVEVEEQEVYLISENFAGIGTREINEKGIKAIEDFFKRSN